MQEWYILGAGKGVLFREVSSVQECPHREREREVSLCIYIYTGGEGEEEEGAKETSPSLPQPAHVVRMAGRCSP